MNSQKPSFLGSDVNAREPKAFVNVDHAQFHVSVFRCGEKHRW
jgi:hypothetical protein